MAMTSKVVEALAGPNLDTPSAPEATKLFVAEKPSAPRAPSPAASTRVPSELASLRSLGTGTLTGSQRHSVSKFNDAADTLDIIADSGDDEDPLLEEVQTRSKAKQADRRSGRTGTTGTNGGYPSSGFSSPQAPASSSVPLGGFMLEEFWLRDDSEPSQVSDEEDNLRVGFFQYGGVDSLDSLMPLDAFNDGIDVFPSSLKQDIGNADVDFMFDDMIRDFELNTYSPTVLVRSVSFDHHDDEEPIFGGPLAKAKGSMNVEPVPVNIQDEARCMVSQSVVAADGAKVHVAPVAATPAPGSEVALLRRAARRSHGSHVVAPVVMQATGLITSTLISVADLEVESPRASSQSLQESVLSSRGGRDSPSPSNMQEDLALRDGQRPTSRNTDLVGSAGLALWKIRQDTMDSSRADDSDGGTM